MIAKNRVPLASSQPDLKLMDRLTVIEDSCLILVTAITLVVLAGWLVPALGAWLAVAGPPMKATTALCMLLGAGGLALSKPMRSDCQLSASRLSGAIVALAAGIALLVTLTGSAPDLDAVRAANADLAVRMSVQSAVFLVLLGLSLLLARARKTWLALVADAATMGLVVLVLVVFAGYLFGATDLYGQSSYVRATPQSLLCMALLSFVRVVRRAEYGIFSVLVGVGIGSQIARLVLPFALTLPFLLDAALNYSMLDGWLSARAAGALSAAITTILLIGLAIVLAWHISRLERNLRDMSLTDELTQVYNLRGFQFLGEQALREARRAQAPLTILYFDVDELKQVNDTFGHESGSQLLRDLAGLLRTHMRSSDIVARVGGDEFAVVFHGSLAEAAMAMRRMAAAMAAGGPAGKPYALSYSVGQAFCDWRGQEAFADLVARADAVMYEHKRLKRAA